MPPRTAIFSGIKLEDVQDAFLRSDLIARNRLYHTNSVDIIRIGRSKIFLELLGINDDSNANNIASLYVHAYPKINAPVSKSIDLIERLSLIPEVDLGIITNGLSDVQYGKLETLGLRNKFSHIFLSEDLAVRKPDPKIFLEAAKRTDKLPQQCMYVGNDYEEDILGAFEAGFQTCWFNPVKFTSSSNKNDFEVADLSDIFDIVLYLSQGF